MIFDPVHHAKQELVPILRALVSLTGEEQNLDQADFFRRILNGLDRASDSADLADPLMTLSMSAFSGFQMTSATTFLLDQLLEKAHQLSASLASEPDELH